MQSNVLQTENERCSAASLRSRPNPRLEIFSTSLGRLCQRNKFKGQIRNSPNQNAVTISCYDSSPNVWTLLSSVSSCRDGALASHQCGPGSIPIAVVICGLSLLVLYSAPRGFLRVLRFPLSSKTSICLVLC